MGNNIPPIDEITRFRVGSSDIILQKIGELSNLELNYVFRIDTLVLRVNPVPGPPFRPVEINFPERQTPWSLPDNLQTIVFKNLTPQEIARLPAEFKLSFPIDGNSQWAFSADVENAVVIIFPDAPTNWQVYAGREFICTKGRIRINGTDLEYSAEIQPING